MLVKLVQFWNAQSPMELRLELAPNPTLIKPEQFKNVLALMEVTLAGMLMLVNLVQPANALSPIEVTLVGMVMLCKPEQ